MNPHDSKSAQSGARGTLRRRRKGRSRSASVKELSQPAYWSEKSRPRTRSPAFLQKTICHVNPYQNLLSGLDRNLSDHVGMEPAVIRNGADRFQHDAVLAV